jgi:hypothetical protein
MGVSMVAVRDMVRGECEFGGVSKGEERFNREGRTEGRISSSY